YDIAAGDVIMSGTPSGVGPVQKGDVIHCEIEGVCEMTTKVI
ncbi:MAG: 5-carboxymethyl-2-hydroxymuconate isomerase, partial [Candidatus Puniceispirillum sp. TMED52]